MSNNKPDQLTVIQREVELLQRLVELREHVKNANITVNRFEAGCGITTVYNGCTIVGEPKKKGARTTSNTASISTSNLTGNGSATGASNIEPPPPVEETPQRQGGTTPPPSPASTSSTTTLTPPPPPQEF
mgnify:CR=1 FL=1